MARLPPTIAPSEYFASCTAMRAPGFAGSPCGSRSGIGPRAVSSKGMNRESVGFAPS